MFSKIKAIKSMRDQAKKMQNALADIVETAEKGGVKVTMNGNQVVERVEIADALLGDRAKLEALLKDAVNDAVQKIQKRMASKVKEMGGLDAFKNLGLS